MDTMIEITTAGRIVMKSVTKTIVKIWQMDTMIEITTAGKIATEIAVKTVVKNVVRTGTRNTDMILPPEIPPVVLMAPALVLEIRASSRMEMATLMRHRRNKQTIEKEGPLLQADLRLYLQ
jgi:hypothetical protein